MSFFTIERPDPTFTPQSCAKKLADYSKKVISYSTPLADLEFKNMFGSPYWLRIFHVWADYIDAQFLCEIDRKTRDEYWTLVKTVFVRHGETFDVVRRKVGISERFFHNGKHPERYLVQYYLGEFISEMVELVLGLTPPPSTQLVHCALLAYAASSIDVEDISVGTHVMDMKTRIYLADVKPITRSQVDELDQKMAGKTAAASSSSSSSSAAAAAAAVSGCSPSPDLVSAWDHLFETVVEVRPQPSPSAADLLLAELDSGKEASQIPETQFSPTSLKTAVTHASGKTGLAEIARLDRLIPLRSFSNDLPTAAVAASAVSAAAAVPMEKESNFASAVAASVDICPNCGRGEFAQCQCDL